MQTYDEDQKSAQTAQNMGKKDKHSLIPVNHNGNFQTVASDARSEYSGIRGGGRNAMAQIPQNYAQGTLQPGPTGARANTIHRLIGPNQQLMKPKSKKRAPNTRKNHHMQGAGCVSLKTEIRATSNNVQDMKSVYASQSNHASRGPGGNNSRGTSVVSQAGPQGSVNSKQYN